MAYAPPSLWLTFTEGYRLMLEASWSLGTMPFHGNQPKGDGHSVCVLPGFMADDSSTLVLRRFLDRLGYATQPWGFGRNLGPRGDLAERMVAWVQREHDQHGRKVSLIGHSLGGVYAREIARALPDAVRQVISLGSPFGSSDGTGTNPAVARLFERTSGLDPKELAGTMFQDITSPPPVPSTAIYTKADGVVSWRICMEQDTPLTDNIEVLGSHCGLGLNAMVLPVIADRLAQADGHWQPFQPKGWGQALYPDQRRRAIGSWSAART